MISQLQISACYVLVTQARFLLALPTPSPCILRPHQISRVPNKQKAGRTAERWVSMLGLNPCNCCAFSFHSFRSILSQKPTLISHPPAVFSATYELVVLYKFQFASSMTYQLASHGGLRRSRLVWRLHASSFIERA